ncbi:MAG: peptidoglycan DD-metalloendopeptidase family protein [Rubrivivax sp.]|nr:peptidoglycan DD-metalloendopeptidase family protein [Rubrivivax sp.]
MNATTKPAPSPARPVLGAALLVLVALLTACASPTHRAPVEDRRPVGTVRPGAPVVALPGSAGASAPAGAGEVAVKPLPGAENAGKPGYYTVRPGDTLFRVGLEKGQNWRDLARWNGVENPGSLEVGRVLRVVPPAGEVAASPQPVAAAGRIENRPLDGAAPPAPVASAAVSPSAASASALPRDADPEGEPNWVWPAAGPVATPFDDTKSKGLAITGAAGDPVYAAAEGRVVYAGAGLRGYGNLIIVKHNATYLTAYAHNQTLLVKEDQVVRRGQKIAEMGSSDADRVQLHFEIRRQGKPVDPARLLPSR